MSIYTIIEILKETKAVCFDYWWLVAPAILWILFKVTWVNYIQEKYIKSIEWDLLEIKVPKEMEKRPKTMEEVFSGLHSNLDVIIDTLYDVYLEGMVESWFSLEIVSFGGDIHFYIRTPSAVRGVVESQIYSQHPEAEITKVDDYVNNVPNDIPSKDYDLWGTEMVLQKEDAYPLRVYKDFEDTAIGEFVDPMSNIIEGVSEFSKGEQLWIQILVRPADDKWKEEGVKLVMKLIGRKGKSKPSGFLGTMKDQLADILRNVVQGFFYVPPPMEKAEASKDDEYQSLMLHLSPGEKDTVTAIDDNIKKYGYATKIRWLYIAKNDIFNKTRGNGTAFTYWSQFGSSNLNNLIPDSHTKTSAYYYLTKLRKAVRKRRVLRKYKKREFREKGFVLNTEELATLFHFPTTEVKAPVAPRVEAKKVKPPMGLPME